MRYRGETGLLFLVLCLLAWSQAVEGGRWAISKEEELEIERQVKILNKPYVKTFKDKHGVIYDCVDIYKQPSLDHPLLKNHRVQMRPSSFPKGMIDEHSAKGERINFGTEERCPTGTVLIRRTQKEDLIKAKMFPQHIQLQDARVDGNHYAVLEINTGQDWKYYGAKAQMDVYNLHKTSINQSTSGEIVLMKGQAGPKNFFNAIHFGWNVAPRIYNDNWTHLFTFWTSDGYQNTGCYNLLCPGFVQVSNGMEPGLILPQGSNMVYPSVFKDPKTGNWMLVLADKYKEIIGYWPKELFNNMADVSQIWMGGAVISPLDEPSPMMGNGFLPNAGASYFQFVGVMNAKGEFVQPAENIQLYSDLNETYYAVGQPNDISGKNYRFQFGGPGGWVL